MFFLHSIAKLTEMQQELRDSKRSLKESQTEKEAFENKYNDVLDSMEVTLLDKEMAEERAENLQHEVNMLKEKVDEMHVDLNVFQQEEGKLFSHTLAHSRSLENYFVFLLSHATCGTSMVTSEGQASDHVLCKFVFFINPNNTYRRPWKPGCQPNSTGTTE